jgi:uncharacterized membrane protein (UPF0127 family)
MTRLTPLRAAFSFAIALLWSSTSAIAQDGPQKLAAITLSTGMHAIRAEVARTPEERSIGLMFRKTMPTNDGMLFIFEQPGVQCFWMKNTLLPLSVAFVADDGSIANIEAMKPQTLDSHCSVKPVRFVLEMNDGWFAKRGIKPGMKIRGEPFAH